MSIRDRPEPLNPGPWGPISAVMNAVRVIKDLLFVGVDATADLPERVRDAVRLQQDRSERLIGWCQLALVLLFAALYTVAPKTHMDEVLKSPVPIALILYFLFTVTRLVFSYRTSLPDWYLGLSGLADLTLLMTLIWYFHIQYAQPAPFYLKAPTMLYVFIFIALRALRFEPRYVFRTGVAAALGWSVLLLYALYGDGMDPPVTRDYVEYLTMNLVLLGGELDKILSILIVTGLLTFALMRGRRTLLTAVAETHASAELSRFFAPEVAERITRGDSGPAEELTASVLYIDIRDFTKLSERISPSELMGMLTEYQSRVTPIIAAHGGTVERFTGDGVLASFGAAKPLDGFARQALNAVRAISDEIDAWSSARAAAGQPQVRIGIAVTTGRLIIGAVGGGGKLEYTLVGEPANLAAKIEKLNKDLGTRAIADRATVDRARDEGWDGQVREMRTGVVIADVNGPVDIAILEWMD